jgi:hypothetical protein
MPNTTGSKGLVMVGTGTGFAALLLLLLPGRKRLRAALGLGLVCVISLALGCGGGNNGGGGGPVASHTSISVASSKVASTSPGFSFTISVTGGTTTPTGMVQLFDGAAMLGNAVAVNNNGTATIGILPPSGVGTHTISAHYTGDAGHMASASGNLNCTVTGTTTLTVSGASGSNTVNAAFSITVN